MKHERSPRLLLGLVTVVLLGSAAVLGLAVLDSDAPARLYQLDAVLRLATAAAPAGA